MQIKDLPIPEDVKKIISSSGISTLYPPQEDAIKAGALEGNNLVLASPTASGKTLIAELCAMKHIIEEEGKVLYLTPLRALTSEKFQDFTKYTQIKKRDGQRIKLTISTGDFDTSDPWLGSYDIILTTNEKCDSLLRHRSDWIRNVTLVIADEVHTLIDANRGPTLEVTLTKLLEQNPHAQILALSATIRNADEIAEWLKAKSITTEWRPVKLIEGVYLNGECRFNIGDAITINEEDKDPAVNIALHTIQNGGQALIFANTRRRAVTYAKKTGKQIVKILTRTEKRVVKSVAERLVRGGEKTRLSELLAQLVSRGVAFHHAGLAASHRKIIEDAFREGKIKVVSATPTLAAGVNLPARTVVVTSTRRYNPVYGLYDISVLEYKQMAGRAGRPQYDRIGEAILISRTEDEEDYLMERYILSKPERIWSKLAVERVLRSHVLATIASGFTHSEEGLMSFFQKTFYAFQFDSELIDVLVRKVLEYLYREEMITINKRSLIATKVGHRVSELYIDPVSSVIIRDALENKPLQITNLSLLHLVCRTPDVIPKFYPRRKEIDELNAFVERHSEEFFILPSDRDDSIEFESFLGEVKCAHVLDSWIQEIPEDGILEKFSVEPGDLFRLISSVDWLLYATHDLAKLFGHRELPLVTLDDVGRVRGRILFNAGFKTVDDLKRTSITQLMSLPLIGAHIAKRIKDQVGGFITTEELEKYKGHEKWKQKALSDF
ncbi:MAG: DEAD/DEAH box helicase [Candidatus Ranarchaeia archaeon]